MPIKEAQKKEVREAFVDTNSKDGQSIQILTAASTFAGDSSLGLESIDMMLKTMLSTCKLYLYSISLSYRTGKRKIKCRRKFF